MFVVSRLRACSFNYMLFHFSLLGSLFISFPMKICRALSVECTSVFRRFSFLQHLHFLYAGLDAIAITKEEVDSASITQCNEMGLLMGPRAAT